MKPDFGKPEYGQRRFKVYGTDEPTYSNDGLNKKQNGKKTAYHQQNWKYNDPENHVKQSPDNVY